jgi:hypothetical protein
LIYYSADHHTEKGLLEVLAHSMNTYITKGTFPMWYYEHRSLVEHGLAQIVGREETQIKEPLSLVSIMRYLESKNLTIDGTIRSRFQADQGGAFEDIVLLAITRALQGGKALKDVFQFYGSPPKWAEEPARVVAQTASGCFKNFDMVTEQPVTPSTGIVVSAPSLQDVTNWVYDGGAGWCIPGNRMGPDLMTWLELNNGKHLLLVIQAKCHLFGSSENITANATDAAIRSVIPHRFFASLVSRRLGSSKPDSDCLYLFDIVYEKHEAGPEGKNDAGNTPVAGGYKYT